MADPLDLIDLATASAMLAAGGVTMTAAKTTVLPSLITAASREIQAELHRVIPAQDYDEIITPTAGRPDRGEPPTFRLSRYPVNGSPLVYGGRTTALTVSNTDRMTNQLAYVGFDAAGEPEVRVTFSGATLTRVASGTPIVNDIPFAGLTVQGLADAVNALGGGWSVTANTGTPNPALFPASLLVGAREPKDALNAACVLGVFATVMPVSVDRASGVATIGTLDAGFGQGFGWGYGGGYNATDYDGDCDTGYGTTNQVRCVYNAGYTTIPAAYQNFAAEVVKAMLERLATDTTLQSETAKDYTWAARAVLATTALSTILTSLNKYKDWTL